MSQFKLYPAYKDSGVEWLGEVPESWTAGTLRWYSTIQGGITKGKDYEGRDTISLPYLRVANVQDGFVDLTEIKQISVLESELERYSLRAGDVLMNEGGDNDKLGRGAVWQGQIEPCLHQNHVFAIRPNDLLRSEWLAAFTGSQPARTYFFLSSKQSTNLASISASNIMSLVVPIPPVAEQTQVLRFLDHETTRIDTLIEEQQRLIELLKEQRHAVISHAVTKGLDPTMPMKDSGVEWLGEVPAHWVALTLGRVADSVRTGGTPSESLPDSDLIDGVEWFTPGDFVGGLNLASSDKFVSKLAVLSGDAKVFPAGAVLIVSIGATLGKVGYIRKPASANQQINAVIPSSRVDGYFLAYSLSVKVDAMRFVSNASTIGIMNQEKTKEIWLSLPPAQEQQLITEFLDKQTLMIDTLIQEASGGVSLLQERRSALISAAVTGKIDVRGWQPPSRAQAPVLEEEAV